MLVTGGAGFIGSHLVEALNARGVQKIIVLDNLSSGHRENVPRFPNVRFVLGDILDMNLVDRLARKCDTIFHLAEYIPETTKFGSGHVIKYSGEKPLDDFEVSAKGTLVILSAAKKYRRKVIFASTAAVYGNTNSGPIAENNPTLPVSPYGASKLCAEVYANLYARAYTLPIVVARFFNIYGPRQRKYVMYDLLSKMVNRPKHLEVLGTGREERDFVFVSDAVSALLLLATHPDAEGHVFNVGTGIATPIFDVVKSLLQILNADIQVKFSHKSWAGDIQTLVANVDKIAALGFKPRFSLESGLQRLADWFSDTSNQSAPLPP